MTLSDNVVLLAQRIGAEFKTVRTEALNTISTKISDATTVGRALLTATDAASARATLGAGTSSLALGTTSTTAAAGNDSRLSDARTPLAHKSTHATGGTDALVPSDIGAAATSHTHAGADIASGTVAVARLGTGTPSTSTYLRGDGSWQAVTASFSVPAGETWEGEWTQSTQVAIAAATNVFIPFNTVVSASTAVTRSADFTSFTVASAGLYTMHAMVRYSTTVAGERFLAITINGTIIMAEGHQDALGTVTGSVHLTRKLAVGDVLRFYVWQTGAATSTATDIIPRLLINKIR